jgi:hypothetical protein
MRIIGKDARLNGKPSKHRMEVTMETPTKESQNSLDRHVITAVQIELVASTTLKISCFFLFLFIVHMVMIENHCWNLDCYYR